MCRRRVERGPEGSPMIAAIVIVPLAIMSLVQILVSRRRDVTPRRPPRGHPESMTANLASDAEEYLAWLADHHWPDDEYLELERSWQSEFDPLDTYDDRPVCPGCQRPGHDV